MYSILTRKLKKSNFLKSNTNNNRIDFKLDTIFISKIMVYLDMVYLLLKFSSAHPSRNKKSIIIINLCFVF